MNFENRQLDFGMVFGQRSFGTIRDEKTNLAAGARVVHPPAELTSLARVGT